MNAALYGDMPQNDVTTMDSMLHPTQWKKYLHVSDANCPQPADLWVFMDESMYSLEDGYMQVDLVTPSYPNPPASYDCGGNCVSFLDGHGEFHKWFWGGAPGAGILRVPYAYGQRTAPGNNWGSGGNDRDMYTWFMPH